MQARPTFIRRSLRADGASAPAPGPAGAVEVCPELPSGEADGRIAWAAARGHSRSLQRMKITRFPCKALLGKRGRSAHLALVRAGAANTAPWNPAYEWGNYSNMPAFAAIPLALPGGAVGSADVHSQIGDFVAHRQPVVAENVALTQPMAAACPNGTACPASLASFAPLYEALPANLHPALLNFTLGPNADAAFAR